MSFSIRPERVLGLDGAVPFFDTDAHPVAFYPADKTISLTGVEIEFPDFHHANAYGFAAGAGGGGTLQSCHSFVTLPFQDWGPSDQPGITDDLPDEVIGTVPDDTDILLVRVKLTRTVAPDQINGNDIPVAFQELSGSDGWVMCDGGSLLLEYLPPVSRMIWIRLAATDNGDGTRNVLLTRKQSIPKIQQTFWAGGNDSSGNGWTYGGTNGRYGLIVKSIEQKGPSLAPGGVVSWRRGQGGECSLTDTSDYSAIYEGDIEIVPGRSLIPSTGTGIGSGTMLIYSDGDFKDQNAGLHTFADMNLGAEIAGRTRHVLVLVSAYQSGASNSQNLDSVSIAGVTTTQILRRRTYLDQTGSNDENMVCALYGADMTGLAEEGDVVLDYSNSFWWSKIDVFTVYDLPSMTPVDSAQGDWNSGLGSSQSIDTEDGGVAFAVMCTDAQSGSQSISGMDNVAIEDDLSVSVDSRQLRRVRAFQQTDGSTLSVTFTNTASGPRTFIAVSLPGTPS